VTPESWNQSGVKVTPPNPFEKEVTSMANSTKSRLQGKPKKPTKPYSDFPLYAHATGRWAKKIRGKLHYFGKWDDSDAALQKYLDEKDDLHAGRTPRKTGDGLTIADLCNRYLTAKKHLLDSNELSPRTFALYFSTCEKIIKAFGKNRLVSDLATDDFDQLRADRAKGRGAISLRNDVRHIRMVFKYAYDAGLVERQVRFGPHFKLPSRAVLRREKQQNGKKMFEADELRIVIESAPQPLKAMILLGLNCGFGNTDISSLPRSAVDLEQGWIDFPRPKTAIERRCPLWPETVSAIRESLESRREPKQDSDSDLVFITKYRKRWVRNGEKGNPIDSVSTEFTKLMRSLNLKRPGLSFYALRHVCETIGGESKDQVAVNAIMGHVDNSMAGVYRERISDERLKAVTDTVREWLWGT
jgi:integrase